jgi:1-deoxy-D-xylulose-5-phosphate synthase
MYSNLIIYSFEIAHLRNILYTAQLGLDHPIAIQYPSEEALHHWIQPYESIAIGKQIVPHGTRNRRFI